MIAQEGEPWPGGPRRLTMALEPTDPLTRERLAQLIEELEFQLQDPRKVA
jgi:hypothetical protein